MLFRRVFSVSAKACPSILSPSLFCFEALLLLITINCWIWVHNFEIYVIFLIIFVVTGMSIASIKKQIKLNAKSTPYAMRLPTFLLKQEKAR